MKTHWHVKRVVSPSVAVIVVTCRTEGGARAAKLRLGVGAPEAEYRVAWCDCDKPFSDVEQEVPDGALGEVTAVGYPSRVKEETPDA